MLRKIYLFSLIIMFLSWNFTFNHSLVVILIIQHVYAIRVPLKFSRVLPKAEAFSLYFAYLAEYQNHEEILQFCFVLMQILKLHKLSKLYLIRRHRDLHFHNIPRHIWFINSPFEKNHYPLWLCKKKCVHEWSSHRH